MFFVVCVGRIAKCSANIVRVCACGDDVYFFSVLMEATYRTAVRSHPPTENKISKLVRCCDRTRLALLTVCGVKNALAEDINI